MSFMNLRSEFQDCQALPLAFQANSDGRFEFSELAMQLYANGTSSLFGLDLASGTLTQVADALVQAAARKEKAVIQFINAHCINILQKDEKYKEALHNADILLPDGSGLRIAAKLAGTNVPQNLNGTDLFPELCSAAAKAGESIFLLGGGPDIARQAGNAMKEQYETLDIAGTAHGFFTAKEETQLINQINKSGASILLVGLGVPHQEKWIAQNKDRLNVPVIAGVGGLFDYYSGRIARAPQWLRQRGGEWLWRLKCEPRRLAGRYVVGNARFMAHAAIHALSARGIIESYIKASKRSLDLSIALLALVLLGPLAAALCLLITLEDRGSPIFRQTRIGENGKPFKIWKFRSMYQDAEARKAELTEQNERDAVCFKMKADPRITRVGKLIRRTSIDELPQILNVLSGDMSIVGPRPALPDEVLSYQPRERKRLAGKPGLTCTWQVSGRADIPFDQQVEMDVEYLERISLGEDLSLIARTVPAVLTGKGAY